eukprot:4373653-Alexandrium_andersonii.AAC.1
MAERRINRTVYAGAESSSARFRAPSTTASPGKYRSRAPSDGWAIARSCWARAIPSVRRRRPPRVRESARRAPSIRSTRFSTAPPAPLR